jgi:hypothetical protein
MLNARSGGKPNGGRSRIPQELGRKIKQTTSDFLYDPSFGAKTPFQSALTHIDVGQSEEEPCHAAKQMQKQMQKDEV